MSKVKLFKLKKGFTLIYSYELNKQAYIHEHKLRLYKLNKLIANAQVVNAKKLITYLYFGDYFGDISWPTISGNFNFDFSKIDGSVNLISTEQRVKYYNDFGASNFKSFHNSSFKGDKHFKQKNDKNSIIKTKTFTHISRNEIENFIFWIYNCINKNESISLSLKKMLQNKILLIEKKNCHNGYAVPYYKEKLPF